MVSLLAENDINIRALTIAETGEKAVVVKISNVPGGLARILETLNYAEVNIEHMYSIMTNKFSFGGEQNAYVVLEFDNFAKASEAFNQARIKIIKQGEIVGL